MALKHWKKLSSDALVENKWHVYRHDRFQIDEQRSGEYFYVDNTPSSMVVPLTDHGTLLLVNQYRYMWDRESLEFACGNTRYALPDGSYAVGTPEETAHRELQEETGFSCTRLQEIGCCCPCNGMTNERAYVYLATGLVPGIAAPEETEEFEQVELSVKAFEEKIASGEIWDGMTIAAWTYARPLVEKIIAQKIV